MTNEDVRKASAFQWSDKSESAAQGLAEGKTQKQVAADVDISDRTLRRWLEHDEFKDEVDRLSLLTAVATRAYRLRITNRIIRQKVKDEGKVETDKDILDWLKFAQSETDGSRSDIADRIAALIASDTSQGR